MLRGKEDGYGEKEQKINNQIIQEFLSHGKELCYSKYDKNSIVGVIRDLHFGTASLTTIKPQTYVDQSKLWKNSEEMRIPDHIPAS